MRIALVGYGKMGKTIEKIAIERGHTISFKINIDNHQDIHLIHTDNTDVAIEFTGPESALNNITTLIKNAVPTISGSTGWNEHLKEVHQLVTTQNTSFLWTSNFSVGVNLFFEINKYVAKLMEPHSQYKASMHEVHHTQKLDAPSGTAISLAEQIIQHNNHYSSWKLGVHNESTVIDITHDRMDPVPGTHSVTYSSTIDDIEIKHTAHNREGFATGAVIAAEYIFNKEGIFEMKDVLFNNI